MKKKHVTHSSPGFWLDILHKEFRGESDRACVILAASLLDSALETLLKAKLAPSIGNNDSLLDGSQAPLQSFSAKIDLAYRLGLISPKLARDLHLMRRIRNDFAHNISGCSYEDASVRDRVLELSNSSRTIDCDEYWLLEGVDSAKSQFMLVASWILWFLRKSITRCSPIAIAKDEWGYEKDWKAKVADDEEKA